MTALRAVAAAHTAEDRLADWRSRLDALSDEGGARAQQIASLESKLRAVAEGQATVDRLQAERTAAAGRLVAVGEPVRLRHLDDGIAAAKATLADAQREVAALDGEASIRAAIEYLNAEQRQNQINVVDMRAQAPRLLRDVVLDRLAAKAPTLRAAAAAYVATLTEIAGLVTAANRMSAMIPGSSQVLALFDVELRTPNLPVFAGIAANLNLRGPANERAADILREIGAT